MANAEESQLSNTLDEPDNATDVAVLSVIKLVSLGLGGPIRPSALDRADLLGLGQTFNQSSIQPRHTQLCHALDALSWAG